MISAKTLSPIFTAFAGYLQKCRHLQTGILSLRRFSVPLLPNTQYLARQTFLPHLPEIEQGCVFCHGQEALTVQYEKQPEEASIETCYAVCEGCIPRVMMADICRGFLRKIAALINHVDRYRQIPETEALIVHMAWLRKDERYKKMPQLRYMG